MSLDGPGSGLFGVFDGHGGREVAQFVAKHIKETLTQLEEYKQGQMERALEASADALRVRTYHR